MQGLNNYPHKIFGRKHLAKFTHQCLFDFISLHIAYSISWEDPSNVK